MDIIPPVAGDPAPASTAETPLPWPSLGRPPRLYVMVGLPGAGKTTYVRSHLGEAVRVSLDDIRLMISDIAWDARYEPLVAEAAAAILEALLPRASQLGFDVVLDATNVTRLWRENAIVRARRHGLQPFCVYLDVGFDVASQQNEQRERAVPAEVLERFHVQLEPPAVDEGFVEIIRVGTRGIRT